MVIWVMQMGYTLAQILSSKFAPHWPALCALCPASSYEGFHALVTRSRHRAIARGDGALQIWGLTARRGGRAIVPPNEVPSAATMRAKRAGKTMRMNVAMMLAGVIGLSACNDPGLRAASGVVAVEANEVAQCRFLTNISVEPPLYGPFAGQGTRYARNQVLDEAKRSGGNRVVFERVEPGVPALQIRARAYAC
jgi:hypothetical protein